MFSNSMTSNNLLVNTIKPENIAANRFGYGARSNELLQAKQNPKAWIISQLQPIAFSDQFPSSNDIFIEHVKYQKEKKRNKKAPQENETSKKTKNFARNAWHSMSSDTIKQAIDSSHSISWRLLDFFSNHFSVTANGRLMTGLAPTLEREAIAPHLLGNFSQMLLAVEQHPAMLIYLNNEKSFGPNSRMAKKRAKGLNENLAREILELHTLGVDGGYSQTDVIELAKGITGWSVKNPKKENATGFIFRQAGHEPGTRSLLLKKYPQNGVTQGEQMLRDLAIHPATAKHVCYKLAHHFVSETPSPNLLKHMEETWLTSQGNIKQVMESMLNNDDAWLASAQKFKTPREFIISTFRAASTSKINNKVLMASLTTLGQKPFDAGSPAGFSDAENDWLGASALMARIDWAATLSAKSKRHNAEKIMQTCLGESVTEHTYKSVMRAESREQALTLLLMSPEFQRR